MKFPAFQLCRNKLDLILEIYNQTHWYVTRAFFVSRWAREFSNYFKTFYFFGHVGKRTKVWSVNFAIIMIKKIFFVQFEINTRPKSLIFIILYTFTAILRIDMKVMYVNTFLHDKIFWLKNEIRDYSD